MVTDETTANSNLSATARGYQEWRTGLHVYGDTVLNFQLRALAQPQTASTYNNPNDRGTSFASSGPGPPIRR